MRNTLFWVNYLNLPKVSKMSSLRQSALASSHLKTNYSAVSKKQTIIKKIILVHSIKNDKPIIKRFKPIIKGFKPIIRRIKRHCKTTCKKRGSKRYESMSDDRLLSALISSKPVKKSEKNFDDTKPKIKFSKSRIEKIRKKFNESRQKFSKSKINEIKRNLYEIKNKTKIFLH